ncbi:MAG: DMT family transporter [Spirochaetales bacterium]|nr:DMT family transporter [Spirochaetales bacterium]
MNKTKTGYIAAIFTILVWSTTYISTKILLKSFSPMQISLVRFTIGLIVLLILSPPKPNKPILKEELKLLGCGFLGMFLYYFLENLAAKYTYASNVSVIVTTIPLFTVILAPIFFKSEKFSVKYIAAFILSFGGLLIMFISNGDLVSLSLKGDLTALLAAIIFSLYTLLLRSVNSNTHPLTLTRKTVFYGWIFIVITALITKNIPNPGMVIRLYNLGHFLFLGVLASGLCFVTWAVAIRQIGAIRTSQFIYLVPFITISLSAIILHERITLSRIAGLIMILTGVIVSQRKQEKILVN